MADRKTATKLPPGTPAIVGMLAWLIPGGGHWYIGMRARGVVLFITICLTFWIGVAIAGVRTAVNTTNWHWFMAEAASGVNVILAMMINNFKNWPVGQTDGLSVLKTRDIGVVYAGVAGLLNFLAIFDAIVRSMSGDIEELPPEEPAEQQQTQ